MTIFEDRKNASEAKFRLDEEARFKIGVRRNKLLGMGPQPGWEFTSPPPETNPRNL